MATPVLDRTKPYQEVFGDHEYAFKQQNRCFDQAGNFLKLEGDPPKADASAADHEAALRAKIRAEIEAELAERKQPPEPAPTKKGK
jgi:hypothetical protein